MSYKALVVLTDGFEEIEAVTVIDVLRRGGIEVTTCSLGSSLSVTGAHQMKIDADALFDSVAESTFEALILPGGPGIATMRQSEKLHNRIRRQKEEGHYICAICAAPLVLVDAGVLEEGNQITCYPTCVMELDRKSANVPVVVDSTIITGQAPGSALLFSLVIIKELLGEKVAFKIERALVTNLL